MTPKTKSVPEQRYGRIWKSVKVEGVDQSLVKKSPSDSFQQRTKEMKVFSSVIC